MKAKKVQDILKEDLSVNRMGDLEGVAKIESQDFIDYLKSTAKSILYHQEFDKIVDHMIEYSEPNALLLLIDFILDLHPYISKHPKYRNPYNKLMRHYMKYQEGPDTPFSDN